ncbi:MAG: aerial mycelium formation protein [Actinobacteria bacterium]|nr:aerial mycelium formation protein [Actinomycetota bacterium]
MDRARFQHVLDSSRMGDPTALSMEDLRTRRSELQGVEVTLSYQRRMAQGRLDIVAAERRRRETGGQPLDPEGIVAQLSEILAPRTRGPGNGRLAQLLAPDPDEAETPELDAIAGPDVLASLTELTDDDLDRLVDALAEFESECSAARRQLHERIDQLQAEVVRRYRTGEATVETLLK